MGEVYFCILNSLIFSLLITSATSFVVHNPSSLSKIVKITDINMITLLRQFFNS